MTDSTKYGDVDALIQKASQLHSPPEVARSLLNLTRNADFDIREVVDCIQRDPAMSAKMLQVVNSSRYGLRTPVSNLHQAVALLGPRTVRLIAMTFSIVDTFTTGPAKTLYNEFWRDAITTATGASRLAARLSGLDRNDVYTAGLLSDVGSLVMAQAVGDVYLQLYRDNGGSSLSAAEHEVFGFDHATVAARMLSAWEFPATILSAIARHHDDEVTEPLALANRGGALLADALWEKNAKTVNDCRRWLETHFQMNVDDFTQLALHCREEVTLELEIYGVHLEQSIDCEALIEEARRQCLESSITAAIDLDSFESVIGGGSAAH